jgi:rifampicin phosphotransferase
MKPSYILTLSDTSVTLENVGGKGMSLTKLANAGLPVPGGFHVTTEAYRQFVTANDLQIGINEALKQVGTSQPSTLEIASETIGRLFVRAEIPSDLANAIVNAYASLPGSNPAVAVRSSATAEDLPDASFAGQQETYLNICGADQVLEATRKCWASLWTARAIGYRARQNIGAEGVALAVVVQLLVDAEAAGIMFTANPLNGNRDEYVINAAWGLGEAVVGGAVTPDTITVSKPKGSVIQRDTAEKQVMTVRTETGTEERPVPESLKNIPVLSEEQAVTLAKIGAEIEELYGMPMDIEWTLADGKFAIVQARPVTAIPEAPIKWAPPDPKGTYMRTSAADLMPVPLSPLFQTLGIPAQVEQMQPLGKRLLGPEPVLAKDYFTSINSYAYMNAYISPKSWWWVLTGMLPAYPRLLRNLVSLWREELYPEYLAFVDSKKGLVTANMSTSELWHETRELANAAAYYICGLMFATMGASAGSEMLLTRIYEKIARQNGDPDASTLLMGWDNIPVRSEKSLYDIAMWIRDDEKLTEYVLITPSPDLARQLNTPDTVSVSLFSEFATRFQTHLEKFGHIVFQLDYAEPLPLDHPELLLENIKMYLRGEGTDPHERQQASEQRRLQTAQITLSRLKGFKRWAFQKSLNWGQSMAEVREDALAEIGLAYPKIRDLLRELGHRLVEAEAIHQANDIFWLEKDEISSSVAKLDDNQALEDLTGRVEKRQAFNERIAQITPPPMMPMKKRVMGIKTDTFITQTEEVQSGKLLKGVPTSTGKVTAPACVLHGFEDFDKMRPGDVLVAGTTTPAWTPLFAMASAVVTDIGGPLSHGSIVAREYGIPAVMGTGVATRRIQSGQVITVDGTKGEVILEITEEGQPKTPPPTEWKLPKGAYAVMRNNIVELMADPLSPLFATLGLSAINTSLPRLMNESFGMRGIMPSELILVVNHYAYNNGSVSAKGMAKMIFGAGKIMKMMFTGAVERWTEIGRPHYYQTVEDWQTKNWRAFSSVELADSAKKLTEAAIDAYGALVSGVIPAAWITEALFTTIYNRLIKRRGDPSAPTYLLGYDSLPIRADKSLYSLAEWARQHSSLADYLERTPTSELVNMISTPAIVPVAIWQEWQQRFHEHLQQFGHTLYDLDFAHPLPVDDPAPVLDAFKLYLRGQGVNPYTRQRESAERREQAVEAMRGRLKGLRLKWFNKYLASAQKYAPLREDGLAEIGLAYPLVRQMLHELGSRFAQHNVIIEADDIFWLTEDEVVLTANPLDAGHPAESLTGRIPHRRAEHQAALSVHPPMMLPQLKVFGFDLMALRDQRKRRNKGDVIKGVACSAGRITGPACVLHNPDEFSQMKPGDVLVASITTPAWTPLFAMASAIVTDIGGPLSHGSIVAREYGIPAVLGTGVATRRIHSGQVITVDGAKGEVILETTEEDGPEQPAPPMKWERPDPKSTYARGSLAEHLPNPVSPLFATLGLEIANRESDRMWKEVIGREDTTLIQDGFYHTINGYVYGGFRMSGKDFWAIMKVMASQLRAMLTASTERWQAARQKFAGVVAAWGQKSIESLSPTELLQGVNEVFGAAAKYYTVVQASTLPSATSSEMLFVPFYNKLIKRKHDPEATTFLLGFDTLPVRAEKSLFDIGGWMKGTDLKTYALRTPTESLLADYKRETPAEAISADLWEEWRERFQRHLDEYGHTAYELDFVNPTPAEAPGPLLDAIKMYLEGKGGNPHERQREAAEKREQATRSVRERIGWPWVGWFEKLLKWAQEVGPTREDSIFDMGMGHPLIRRMLGEVGERFVAGGALETAGDIYWLEKDEVEELAAMLERGEPLPRFAERIPPRKAEWKAALRATPPVMLPERSRWGKLLGGGEAKKENGKITLKGVGTSSGQVTAMACVLLGPEDFPKMRPGKVLVATTTTPAWTPLFAMASAVVTDIGGPLSHSSIVAREYGIPAVMAARNATRHIKSGQMVTVDGKAGTVILW